VVSEDPRSFALVVTMAMVTTDLVELRRPVTKPRLVTAKVRIAAGAGRTLSPSPRCSVQPGHTLCRDTGWPLRGQGYRPGPYRQTRPGGRAAGRMAFYATGEGAAFAGQQKGAMARFRPFGGRVAHSIGKSADLSTGRICGKPDSTASLRRASVRVFQQAPTGGTVGKSEGRAQPGQVSG